MTHERKLLIETPHGKLHGQLSLPEFTRTLIVVVKGTDPHGPLAHVIASLLAAGQGILSIDLLSTQEAQYADSAHNVHLHSTRLIQLIEYLRSDADTGGLALGIFAFGPMAAAALRASAQRDADVRSLLLYQGQIDNAGRQYLEALRSPLLVLLHEDAETLQASVERAMVHIDAPHTLQKTDALRVPEASVAWFTKTLA